MKKELKIVLTLLRCGLYGESVTLETSPSEKEWSLAFDLAKRQGVAVLAGEGLSFLPHDFLPSRELLLQWIGLTIQQKKIFCTHRKLINELIKVWKDAGISCIELKGNSIGRLYNVPEARYSCDFDCMLSDYEKGNAEVELHGIEVNRDFYKNSSFNWKGLYVENHQFCTPIRGNIAMKRLERTLQGLLAASDGFPCADFNALFLMEHAWAHFYENALKLKQLCDWAVFRKACRDEVDWMLFEREAKSCGFWHFSESMNKLADLLDGTLENEELDDDDKRLLNDMLADKSIQMNDGWRTRIQLVKNYFSQSWKYRVFSNHSMMYTLCRTALGFVFDRNPMV